MSRRRSARTPRAAAPAPLPLFAWAARQHRQVRGAARIVLRADMRDAEGEPRACIVIPGRLPLAFPSIPAALAALARMEAAHAGR
jgi:hypothetical protein